MVFLNDGYGFMVQFNVLFMELLFNGCLMVV